MQFFAGIVSVGGVNIQNEEIVEGNEILESNTLMINDPSLLPLLKNKQIDDFMRQVSETYVTINNTVSRAFNCISCFKNNDVKELLMSYEVSNSNFKDFKIVLDSSVEFNNSVSLLSKKLFQIINIVMLSCNTNVSFGVNNRLELYFDSIAVLCGCDIYNKNAVDELFKQFVKAVDFLKHITFVFCESVVFGEANNKEIQKEFKSLKFCDEIVFEKKGYKNTRKVVVKLNDEYIRYCVSSNKHRKN